MEDNRFLDFFLRAMCIAVVAYFVIGSVAFIVGAYELHSLHRAINDTRDALTHLTDSIYW